MDEWHGTSAVSVSIILPFELSKQCILLVNLFTAQGLPFSGVICKFDVLFLSLGELLLRFLLRLCVLIDGRNHLLQYDVFDLISFDVSTAERTFRPTVIRDPPFQTSLVEEMPIIASQNRDLLAILHGTHANIALVMSFHFKV